MRVIAGKAKGRRLECSRGVGIRPTSDRVKEAVFSILGPIEGARVLDLFAGAGSLGIEALSRGAASATFIESSPAHARCLRENIEACGFAPVSRCLVQSSEKALARLEREGERFDLVFLDPPYAGGDLDRSLGRLGEAALLAPGARVVAEHPRKGPPPERFGRLGLTDRRGYGQTAVSLFERIDEPGEEGR